jgi:lysophospholipase L1-like esterase
VEVRTETGSRKAFLASAALCVVLGLSCNAYALGSVFGEHSLADGAESLALRGRLLLFGLALIFIALGFSRLARLRRLSASVISVALILVGFEALAAPFVGSDTTLFLRDPELGWRLRPDGEDVWLGSRLKVNSQGMRGELPQDTVQQRLLFLGDSVVFGAFLENDSDTLTARVNSRLKADGLNAQCLNAGVGGWAPWQERHWYEQEGAALGAGVVLVHIVLNDVTEPLSLTALGGTEEGFQLDRTREPGLFGGSTWATALRRWRRAARGDDPRIAAARAEALGVYELLRSPSLPSSRSAWARHLEEVSALVLSIQAEGAIPVVVSHPYTVQFEVPGLWWPQDAVGAWCEARSVHFVDVGRYVVSAGPDPVRLYHDAVHPNAQGTAVIADGLMEFLRREGLVY